MVIIYTVNPYFMHKYLSTYIYKIDKIEKINKVMHVGWRIKLLIKGL